ncbi:rhodanese-like domain-containing protein, partial [Klebsiella variicola]|uniref:rhodanese-like domain-containing protein n=1 Tax=Klebsiella variicola TaxID=244366 RepID=UPI0039C3B471
GQKLAHGQSRRFAPTSEEHREVAAADARRVADKARVGRASLAELQGWQQEANRTTSLFDVRTPEEFEAGHLPGARST